MLYGKRFFSASILPGKTISTSSAFGNLASTTSTGGVWWGVLSSVLRPARFVYTLSTLILNWTVKTICSPFFVFIIDFLRCDQISNTFKKRQIRTSYYSIFQICTTVHKFINIRFTIQKWILINYSTRIFKLSILEQVETIFHIMYKNNSRVTP